MKIKYSKSKPIREEEFEFFSQELGSNFSEKLKQFFINFNGSKPQDNVFKISHDNECGIDEFIPFSKILEERKYLYHVDSKVIPIAWAEGGNYIVVDLDNCESVYFLDHEEPQRLVKLATDIYEFLSEIKPFNLKEFVLKEGQVKSGWINPELLKKN
ncbi:hypothetical protein BOO30_07335 [Vibrio navarrensis]|uniref:SMI1/KNR4 family protein n=1 Tax=Vibrio navarrensis TaxID=29495 RepID=UPI001867C4CE|nr:SMI1/KNR4 family protein [Vibrio navarrensis]MBE3665694.1 hypothetical protein [Vibrio navarrensis]MBE4577306.1 hypothetical protein [Vibrio navarrensis]MBE4596217.1 hypothetical protein [Vibrio navarrensis]MBE4601927.1 hypothetical protein [Vibrio navarrensis]